MFVRTGFFCGIALCLGLVDGSRYIGEINAYRKSWIFVSTLQVGYRCSTPVIFYLIKGKRTACIEYHSLFCGYLCCRMVIERDTEAGIIDLESVDASIIGFGYERDSFEIILEECL